MTVIWRCVGFPDATLNLELGDLGERILGELRLTRPVQLCLDAYHSVMAYGYKQDTDGTERILVMNPQRGIGNGWYALHGHIRWTALWTGLAFRENPGTC